MKTDASFRMKKQTKIILGSIYDKVARNLYKKAAINAQVSRAKNGYHIFKGND
jgi:hypothetical protein